MSRIELASDLLFVIAAGLAIAACAMWSTIAALVAGAIVAFVAGAVLYEAAKPARLNRNSGNPFEPGA